MKQNRTKLDCILLGLSFACILGTSLYFLLNWNNIDSSIPAHYGSGGNIDRIGDKSELISILCVTWFLFITLILISKFPTMWNIPTDVNESNREKIYQVTRHLLSWQTLIVTVNLCFLSLYPLTNRDLPPFFFLVFIGLVLGLLIIYFIKIYRIK